MRRISYLILVYCGLYGSILGLAKLLSAAGVLDLLAVREQNFVLALGLIGIVGGLISWVMSASVAEWSVSARPYDSGTMPGKSGDLAQLLATLAPKLGLKTPPAVAVYDSPDVNAFAVTTPRGRAKVLVTTGFLEKLSRDEAEAILSHQLAKIAGGDVSTLLMIQGIINVFSVFPTRMFSLLMGTSLRTADEETPVDQTENHMKTVLEVVFVVLVGLIARQFARSAEARADALAAKVVGGTRMVDLLNGMAAAQPATATREMFTSPLNFRAKVGKRCAVLSYHNGMPRRAATLEKMQASRAA